MACHRVMALVAAMLVCTTTLPTYEDEVHELHETVLLEDSQTLRTMEHSYTRAMQSVSKYSATPYDTNHFNDATSGHDALKRAMTKAHNAAKKVHDLKEQMRQVMAKLEAAEAAAAEKAEAAAKAKAEAEANAKADEQAEKADAEAGDAAAQAEEAKADGEKDAAAQKAEAADKAAGEKKDAEDKLEAKTAEMEDGAKADEAKAHDDAASAKETADAVEGEADAGAG